MFDDGSAGVTTQAKYDTDTLPRSVPTAEIRKVT
jgi:hypothetical protein